MALGALASAVGGRLMHYAITGVAGTVMVKGATKLAPRVGPVARRAAVRTVATGIVAGRKVGEVTEEARLKAGDILAEAHATLGEQAPAPSQDANGTHDHEH